MKRSEVENRSLHVKNRSLCKIVSTFCVTPLKMPLPRAPIDLARRGAWSAETTHAPRVPDVAVAAHRRAQPISKTFSRGVTSA